MIIDQECFHIIEKNYYFEYISNLNMKLKKNYENLIMDYKNLKVKYNNIISNKEPDSEIITEPDSVIEKKSEESVVITESESLPPPAKRIRLSEIITEPDSVIEKKSEESVVIAESSELLPPPKRIKINPEIIKKPFMLSPNGYVYNKKDYSLFETKDLWVFFKKHTPIMNMK